MSEITQATVAALASGKDHKQENFPVASWLVRADARGPIMAYYRFARAADDIADNPQAAPQDKLRLLGEMRAGLSASGNPHAMALAQVCAQRGIDLAHAHELLDAFVQDVHVARYATWEDLMAYCRVSAMPVGRFVLDVHGEDRALWPMNDALCAALQIINHLQDCGKDYRAMDRVYVPMQMLAAAGAEVGELGAARASGPLRGVIARAALKTQGLLAQSAPFADHIRDWRLACEVAVIQHLAEDLVRLLIAHDPLSQNVHHSKPRGAWLALGGIARLIRHRVLP